MLGSLGSRAFAPARPRPKVFSGCAGGEIHGYRLVRGGANDDAKESAARGAERQPEHAREPICSSIFAFE